LWTDYEMNIWSYLLVLIIYNEIICDMVNI
jgi:hypothetical protein